MNRAVALVVALAPTAVLTLATSPSATFPRAASPSRAALLRAAADPVDLAGDGGCVLTTVRAAVSYTHLTLPTILLV